MPVPPGLATTGGPAPEAQVEGADAPATDPTLVGKAYTEMQANTLLAKTDDLMRKEYRELTLEEKMYLQAVKLAGETLVELMKATRDCRERSIAITRIEEGVMWAVKGMTAK